MNKLTRIIAGSLTSIIAVGALSAPAFAVEAPGEIETAVCAIVDGQLEGILEEVDDLFALLAPGATAVGTAQDAMESSGTVLGASALDYFQALDGDGSKGVTLAVLVDAAEDFSENVVTWIDAVDTQTDNTVEHGLNKAIANYLAGMCPVAP